MSMDKIFTQSEVAAAVKEKLDQTKVDSFRFRIMRRHSPNALAEMFAVFDGATYEHLTNTEAWLNTLGGGGHYEISVYHESDKGKLIAAPYKVTFPGTYYIRPKGSAIQSPTWVGPTQLMVPKLEELIASDASTPSPASPIPPASPLPTTSVGGPTVPALQQVIAAPVSRVEAAEANRLLSVSSELSRQEKELAKREAALEAEAREARLRAEFAKMIPVASPAPSGGMSMEVVMLKLSEMQMSNMQMMMKMQEDSNNRQMEMLKRVTERPAVDPNLQMLLDRIDKKGEKMEEFKAVTEMMGTMATTTMQIIQSNAELMAASQGPVEGPGFKLARQALVSLGGLINQSSIKGGAQIMPQEETAALPENAGENTGPQKYSQLELLERAILRGDPDEKIIARFLKALRSKKFNRYVTEKFQGSLPKLVEAHLGEWAMEDPENMEYLNELIPKLFKAGVDAKLITPPAPEAPTQAAPAPPTNGAAPVKKKRAPVEEAPAATETKAAEA